MDIVASGLRPAIIKDSKGGTGPVFWEFRFSLDGVPRKGETVVLDEHLADPVVGAWTRIMWQVIEVEWHREHVWLALEFVEGDTEDEEDLTMDVLRERHAATA